MFARGRLHVCKKFLDLRNSKADCLGVLDEADALNICRRVLFVPVPWTDARSEEAVFYVVAQCITCDAGSAHNVFGKHHIFCEGSEW